VKKFIRDTHIMFSLLKKSVRSYVRHGELIGKMKAPSNEVRVVSKRSIALLRRGNLREAESLLRDAETTLRKLAVMMKQHPDFQSVGFYQDAAEEYVEAIAFYSVMTKQTLRIPRGVVLTPETVLSGICDTTGELLRRAVTIAGNDEAGEIERYRNSTEDVIAQLTVLGLSGKLRSKYDDVERNLQRIEGILYDIRLKR